MVDLKVASSIGFVVVVFSVTMATIIFKGRERNGKFAGHGMLNKMLGSWKENPV